MVDLCAAADAGADTMAPLSLSRMAPDPSRHARAVRCWPSTPWRSRPPATGPASPACCSSRCWRPAPGAPAWRWPAASATVAAATDASRRWSASATACWKSNAAWTRAGAATAGQFAFVRFDRREGAHPYTIASAPRPDGAIRFEIKALGDYTSRLPGALRVGQPVEVEGPYGCFQLDADAGAPQVWVAGGIGVTPFRRLDTLAADPSRAPSAQLHYCVRDAAADPFAATLRERCAALPSIQLNIHDAAGTAAGRDAADAGFGPGTCRPGLVLRSRRTGAQPARRPATAGPDRRALAPGSVPDALASKTAPRVKAGPLRRSRRRTAPFSAGFPATRSALLALGQTRPSSTPDPLAIGTTIDPSRQARGPDPVPAVRGGRPATLPENLEACIWCSRNSASRRSGGGFDPGAGGRMLGRHRGQ